MVGGLNCYGKTPGIYRTTISISADLKRRVDKAKEDVNWSAIAAQAFESKLAEISAKKERKCMDDVIQRLRASKAAMESDDHNRGHEAGKSWATNDAEFAELKRLDEIDPAMKVRALEESDPWYAVAAMIHADADSLEIESFVDDNGERTSSADFALGFIEGALSVWNAVKAKL